MSTKDCNQEEMVLLASYQQFEDAKNLIDFLADNGITAYMRNEFSNRMMGSLVDVGGYRVEISNHDEEEALRVLDENHISLPNDLDSDIGKIASLADRLPFFRNKPLEYRLWAMLGLLIVFLGLLALILYLLSSGIN
ncbi:putative signal transducing protein [Falsiporphyromonas endometrii]|uniref:Signal transducing protein n=1 Tax=Falsiporphyromonas endometrii TaxID=1387297 RepID=A0ABV9K8V1_9PORP